MAMIAERENLENQDTQKMTYSKGKLISEQLTRPDVQESRKTLKTIQLSSKGEKQVNGKENAKESLSKNKEKIQFSKGKSFQPMQIYSDPPPQFQSTPKKFSEHSTQTDTSEKEQISPIDKEAFDLMVNEEIPEKYWEDVAEQRRSALSEALQENKELHDSICELKEENEKLAKIASKAEYFAEVIKSFIGEDEADEEEDEGNDTCAVIEAVESKEETEAENRDQEKNTEDEKVEVKSNTEDRNTDKDVSNNSQSQDCPSDEKDSSKTDSGVKSEEDK